jgi:hypothetical protein
VLSTGEKKAATDNDAPSEASLWQLTSGLDANRAKKAKWNVDIMSESSLQTTIGKTSR